MRLTSWWSREVFGVPIVRDVFIETGCKFGDTIEEARRHFRLCHSVEIDGATCQLARLRFAEAKNVAVHCGDSRVALPIIIDPTLTTTFYLDAHCEGDRAYMATDTECPLLDEVRIIVSQPWKSRPLILVDDINMMKPVYWSDPMSNHALFKREDWPMVEDIATLLPGYRYMENEEGTLGIWG